MAVKTQPDSWLKFHGFLTILLFGDSTIVELLFFSLFLEAAIERNPIAQHVYLPWSGPTYHITIASR